MNIEDLKSKLNHYIDTAKVNEDKLTALFDATKRISKLNTLSGFLEEYQNMYPWSFSDNHPTIFTLVLIDKNTQIKQLLLDEGIKPSDLNSILIFPDEALIARAIHYKAKDKEGNLKFHYSKTYRGPYDKKIHENLILKGSGAKRIVIHPLIRHTKLLGALIIASNDSNRFPDNFATDFSDFYRDIFSITLENALLFSKNNRDVYIDPLTELHNRRYFNLKYHEIYENMNCGENISYMILDIDKFKYVNDTYGHPIGDEILKGVANILKNVLNVNHTMARFGGEEFIIVIPELETQHVVEIAENIRKTIESENFKISNHCDLNITLSIGVSAMIKNNNIETSDSNSMLFTEADQALYTAKEQGRNMVKLYENGAN